MGIFTFGKKRRSKLKKSSKKKSVSSKLPKRLLHICKVLKVRVKSKSGKYKSMKVLVKQCLKKIQVLKKKMAKKVPKKKSKVKKTNKTKRSYKRKASVPKSSSSVPKRSSSVPKRSSSVPKRSRSSRSSQLMLTQGGGVGHRGKVYRFGNQYAEYKVDPSNGYATDNVQYPGLKSASPQYEGINKEFYGAKVPAVLPPEWNFNYTKDGVLNPVGAPFNQSAKFGRRHRKKY